MELDAEAFGGKVGIVFFDMNEEAVEQETDNIPMHVREIQLEDGRYMIFFTFGDEEQEADV